MTAIVKKLAVALGLAGSAAAADNALFLRLSPDREDLEAYRWSVRPVLVFAPDSDDAQYTEQIALLRAAEAGLAERDIVVLTDTAPDEKGRLRAALAVDGFEVLLVGKDGGVKLRQETPLSVDDLFATIDAMPMRQREMVD
ncbi:MAG: DUF4174 domain-containing protein [Sagittula sp.]|uniref:DUF4174 domain-containing protein n=1 Tax=Sagittula sp. TaxID=2038081 RepID=UPI0040587687